MAGKMGVALGRGGVRVGIRVGRVGTRRDFLFVFVYLLKRNLEKHTWVFVPELLDVRRPSFNYSSCSLVFFLLF